MYNREAGAIGAPSGCSSCMLSRRRVYGLPKGPWTARPKGCAACQNSLTLTNFVNSQTHTNLQQPSLKAHTLTMSGDKSYVDQVLPARLPALLEPRVTRAWTACAGARAARCA